MSLFKVSTNEKREIKETIKIPELKIEVEIIIHHQDEKLAEISIPEGWRLLKINEIIFLHNQQEYRKKLNLENTWEFIEQPLNYNNQQDYVTGFYAYPGGVSIDCMRGPFGSISALGVRFCRDIEN